MYSYLFWVAVLFATHVVRINILREFVCLLCQPKKFAFVSAHIVIVLCDYCNEMQLDYVV